VAVAERVPRGVICLISALDFHGITTQVPHQVYIAVERGSRIPRLDYPPIRVFHVSSDIFIAGIETHKIDKHPVRIYSPEKTLADCFKYRNKIGLHVATEALKLYRERKKLKLDDLMKYAKVCRVENVMRPYLEALL
jgi:predicted transcriptional regulator of viral defense system